jgi:hypothetical protein
MAKTLPVDRSFGGVWDKMAHAREPLISLREVLAPAGLTEFFIWRPVRKLVILLLILFEACLDLVDWLSARWPSLGDRTRDVKSIGQ